MFHTADTIRLLRLEREWIIARLVSLSSENRKCCLRRLRVEFNGTAFCMAQMIGGLLVPPPFS